MRAQILRIIVYVISLNGVTQSSREQSGIGMQAKGMCLPARDGVAIKEIMGTPEPRLPGQLDTLD